MKRERLESPEKPGEKVAIEHTDAFTSALSKIARAGAVSSRAAIEAAQATKPSRHTRFVHNPAKGRT
jgi:hypothetical protein